MRVICFGELIVDFTSDEPGKTLSQVNRFCKHPGGAPANVAIGLQHHGVRPVLWSKVGDDSFGRYLVDKVRQIGLSTDGIRVDPAHPTKIAFVGLNEAGERYFEFHNKDSAERYIRSNDVDMTQLEGAAVLHFGGVALLGETTFRTTLRILREARQQNCLISFDPNIRLDLVGNRGEVQTRLNKVLSYVDILKLSVEDWTAFFSHASPEQLVQKQLSLLIMTEGDAGVRFITPEHRVFVQAENVEVVDTTGAGDAFLAAFLSKLAHEKFETPVRFGTEQLMEWGRFANSWAAKAITEIGAVSVYT
ncbi:MAG: carbohydrate kinase family protein [Calditrichia bacterium]